MTLIEARDILLKISNLTTAERKAVKTVVAMINRKVVIGKRDSFYSLDLKDLPNEIWHDVTNYEGRYQISNCGRAKSFYNGKVRILRAESTPEGYLRVSFCKNGRGKNLFVHRLVAQAFIPNPEGKPQVNHIDGDKTNNRVENLEWMTSEENIRHAFTLGLSKQPKGSKSPSSKFKPEKIREIRRIYVKGSHKFGVSALARMFKTSEETIRDIVKYRSYLDVV